MTNIENITMADLNTIANLLSYGVADKVRYQVRAVGAILNALRDADGPIRCEEIAKAEGLSVQMISWTMRRLMKNGMVKRVGMGTENVAVYGWGWDKDSDRYCRHQLTLENVPIVGYVLAH